ncbi:MAG: D-2-hydroxyacid dehydrogenase [Bacteroidales bacterium]|nr:D-2-hydroxyacid dehydrogenase [Bacteroidales bacterium]
MKIAFLDTETMGEIPNLHQIDQLGEVIYYPTTQPFQTIERLQKVDIAITCKVVIDRNVLDHTPDLKLICAAATGINHIDAEYAHQKGITVKNVADYSTHSVAQHTFALILSLYNHIPYYDRFVKEGEYAKHPIFSCMEKNITEIRGKIFGIIGLGAIGKKVAEIAEAFGAEIWYYSTTGKNFYPKYKRTSLDELLSNADIVSIHAPLNDTTRNLITFDRLTLMKPTAILINTGRGGIINEADLARAIDNDIIAGAGLDVFSREPILPDNPIMHVKKTEKLILTPHNAWTSIEARTVLIEGIVKNIKEFINK